MKWSRFLSVLLAIMLLAAAPLQAQQFIWSPALQYRPNITIAAATVDTEIFNTSGATSLHTQWKFATVTGTYTTCTAQLKTSYDGGITFLTLGTAATVTTTTGTVNAWTVLVQAPVTTGVTTSAVSATVALGFGNISKFTYACSVYGTTAPVSIAVLITGQ